MSAIKQFWTWLSGFFATYKHKPVEHQEKKFIHCDIDADKPQRVLFRYG